MEIFYFLPGRIKDAKRISYAVKPTRKQKTLG